MSHGRADRTSGPNRLDRRKARTRAALVRAAQACIAAGQVNVPILEITQAADVGLGSFYNHFESKEQLFQAAVEDALDAYGAAARRSSPSAWTTPPRSSRRASGSPGACTAGNPELSKVLLHNGLALAGSDRGSHPAPAATSRPRPAPAGSPSATPSWP